MVVVVFVAIFVCGCVSLSAGEMPLNMEACEIGDVVQNECSKCICTIRHVYECKLKPCKRSHKAQDFILANKSGMACQPHKIYHHLSTICICRGDGNWPHESCYTTFRSLPAAKVVKTKCNKYAIVDCNICMCNGKGHIDNDRCTQNDCDEDEKKVDHRRKAKSSHVFGNCLARNWYSLAPCQFCYCLNNNKLVCNTGNIHVKGIQLGSYNFSLCGPDYVNEALTFMETADVNDSKALRMGQNVKSVPTMSNKHTTAKPHKHKSADIRDLFEKADLERMQQKHKEKSRGHEDIPIVTKNIKSHSKPIERERIKQSREGSVNNDRDDKADRDDDDEDEEDERRDTEESEVKGLMKSKQDDKGADDDDDADDGNFDLGFIGAAVRNSLPKSLKKIFNMRKSVVLNTTTKCEPGTHTIVECNICHCMKNGKMLCTNKKCN